MANWTILKRAPVQEAILDIKFNLKGSSSVDGINLFCNHIKEKFPDQKPLVAFNFMTKFESNTDEKDLPKFETTKHNNGYLLNSINGKEIIQVGPNTLSFHILEPYPEWPTILNHTKELWDLFLNYNEIDTVNRIALRYINKMDIPLPLLNGFEEYLVLLPRVPNGIPQAINNFFIQLNIPNAEGDLIAIVNESFEPPKDSHIRILLDIDVFKLSIYKDWNHMWNDFEKVRDFKNQIFFNSITPKTISMYE
jgi:uncharacterized protein (TIGR04255 family)